MKLTKENILLKLDERSIYQNYFPEKIDLRKNKYKNPFRADKHEGSCHFNYYKNKFYFFDKANNDVIDVFTYLQKTYGLTFPEALCKINLDFDLKLDCPQQLVDRLTDSNLIKISNPIITTDEDRYTRVEFKIKSRKFNKADRDFWSKCNITEDILELYNIKAVNEYAVTTDGVSYTKGYANDPLDPCYVFQTKRLGKLYVKFYRPLAKSKTNKWRTNCVPTIIHGYDQLKFNSPNLIITKSLKDVMSLYSLGFESISPISENIIFNPYTMNEFLTRYKNIYVLFDDDPTGHKYSDKYVKEYKVQKIFIPKYGNIKDISDVINHYGKDYGSDLINNLIRGHVRTITRYTELSVSSDAGLLVANL